MLRSKSPAIFIRNTRVAQPILTSHSKRFASSNQIQILEVGPRDGLQNIKAQVPSAIKIELIHRLVEAGVRNIEATSFVSPKWVPQLADGAEVMSQILGLKSQRSVRMPVLAPNMKGLQNAIKSGATEIVVFASATEAFSKRNQNCTVDEALIEAEKVANEAIHSKVAVRGVVSCIFSDPYSGPTRPDEVVKVVKRFLSMGCHEVGLGDTLGVGTPRDTQNLLEILLKDVPADKLAGHFHDTYGQAVTNVSKAFEMGIRSFDSSVAGLGGCPYAKGARGNLATEDVVYMLENSGVDTGIDLPKLALVGDWISRHLDIPNGSRAGTAIVAKMQSSSVIKPQDTRPIKSKSSREWKTVEEEKEYRVSKAGNTVKITLTRSEKGNSMTAAMLEGLTKWIRKFALDKTVFHIIITAEGKFYCTGMDLSRDTDRTSRQADEISYYEKVSSLFEAIDQAPQTTIAAIDGPCFGGGVGLGFVCDVRLVSEKARWTLTEIKLGLSPAIISRYMAREWGLSFFKEAMLSGREVIPQELHRIGAVHQLCSDSANLEAALDTYLDNLDRCAPQSAANCKRLVQLAWTDPNGFEQEAFIRKTFDTMMVPGSEGDFGIKQFQKKIKKIDWGQFWSNEKARL